MHSPEDEKDRPSKPPFDDQPTTPAGELKLPARGPSWTDTPLPALEQRYEILGEAGRGGMGIVYKARDRETGELVALKVLKPEIAADAAIVERFKNELRLARKITHKNVCRIHEFNRAADGSAYISMEYVEGESLRHVLNRFGNFGVRGGTWIALQICAGLREAHAQGVVHRDLKPENVMLDRAGNVKVMDFGIARSVEPGAMTVTGIMGTPAYMAPEQAAGKAVDQRSDVYALGLILYEMFTGSTAFTGETPVAVALKQIHETPPAPRDVEPELPARIEKAILKCLEKDPAKRFQSVEELEAALTRQAEVKPVVAEVAAEVPLPIHLSRWQRSDYILLGAACVSLVVSLLLWDRVFPFSTVHFMDRGAAEKVVKDVLAKLQINAGPEKGRWWLTVGDYPGMVLEIGPERAHRLLEQGAASRWEFGIAGPDVPRDVHGERSGTLEVDQNGKVLRIAFAPPPKSLAVEVDPQKVGELAIRFFSNAFSVDMSRAKPRVTTPTAGSMQCHFEIKDPSSGLDNHYSLNYSAGWMGAVAVIRWWWGVDVEFLPQRGPLVVLALTLFASALFFLRRLHRQPVSRPLAVLALLATAFAFVGFYDFIVTVAEEFTRVVGVSRDIAAGLPHEWATVLDVVFSIPPFLLMWAGIYFILSLGMHYGRRNDPTRVRTFSDTLGHPLRSQAGGLAVVRGVFLGIAFIAAYSVLLTIVELAKWFAPIIWVGGIIRGEPIPGFWLELPSPSTLLVALRVMTIPFLEAFVLVWLLIALPASLLKRVVPRWPIVLAALTGLWLLAAYHLLGAVAYPAAGFYIILALQALFVSAVYLRWDLLTAASAIFTVEFALLGYAAQQMFHDTYSSLYGLPLLTWLAFILFGSFVAFRPQLGSAYRRVVAVFE